MDAHKWNYLVFSYTPGVGILSYYSNSHTDSLKCAVRVTGVGGPSRRCWNCLPARQDIKSEAIPELMVPLKSWRMMDGCTLLYSHSIHQTGLGDGEEIGIMIDDSRITLITSQRVWGKPFLSPFFLPASTKGRRTLLFFPMCFLTTKILFLLLRMWCHKS